TEEQLAIVTEAGKLASQYNAEQSTLVEEACKAELEAKGVVFVPVEDKQAWRDASADAIAYVAGGLEEYVEKIQALDQE
ncbi:MAG: C4-dicarboxylate ABC transporter substrate-binding protein, partial [Clostridia bacterium]|nr:C4-dicarboxylate ABC transporter substrate-binding protein [Clostridia bacterium]